MHLKAAIYILMLISWSNFEFNSAASNSITTLQNLKHPRTLISSNGTFKLGFFSPTNSTNRYLGIWHNNKKNPDNMLEIVWVANRDNPVKDTSSMLVISSNGNLQVIDAQSQIYWSSNISSKGNISVAQLLDTGNLILLTEGTDARIWQSYDHPTDSFFPGVKLTFNKSVHDTKTNIQSWKSNTDPSSGLFRLVSLPWDLPEFFIVAGNKPYWRSGPWNGYQFLGVPYYHSEVSTGVNVDDHNGSVEVSYEVADQYVFERYVLTYDGTMLQKDWNDTSSKWVISWRSLSSECDVYGKCGEFAICDPRKEPICECLTGFNPKNVHEWRKGNWTNGCVRRTELQCHVSGSKEDEFLQFKQIKVPDYAHRTIVSQEDCQSACLKNCSCFAYSHYSGIECMLWNVSLIDLQQYSADGADLFVRLSHSELSGISNQKQQNPHAPSKSPIPKAWIIFVSTVLARLIAGIFVIIIFLFRRYSANVVIREVQSVSEFGDLPMFELEKLVTATNNFGESNKLGRGGFGIVYKGKLEDGVEVAVKRLSRLSGQGLTEFMTEVLVISKLQHRNLVRLLGCCVDGEEKLLVYEYMPNKSLDALLFDQGYQEPLAWNTRLNIIQGICRGLLYLHRDSRLRVIHRDLKASNILLDDKLTPKISDFGMARIFGGNEDQADTNRVVGTYGYMSPEYAMEGRFSEKSDVFSFGVLLLEIVSGRRNSSFKDEESLSLLAYAWKLWKEDNAMPLIDPAISELGFQDKILRCIQVALLCVQEYPEDRPNMSTVISMIDSELFNLLQPTRPGFTQRRYAPRNQTLQDENVKGSVNLISLSGISGR